MTSINPFVDNPHWRCPDCDVNNSKSREKCLGCDKIKPKNVRYRKKLH